jgi:hypothetical protein
MAFEIPLFLPGHFKAGADLSAAGNQFKFVKLDSTADQVVLCAAATDIPIGILQNTPGSGESAEVMVAGISKVQGDASLAIGVQIGTSADGQADAKTVGTDTTEYVVGRVIGACGNAAELATVAFSCLSPHRAA